jgi:hypothetical protein
MAWRLVAPLRRKVDEDRRRQLACAMDWLEQREWRFLDLKHMENDETRRVHPTWRRPGGSQQTQWRSALQLNQGGLRPVRASESNDLISSAHCRREGGALFDFGQCRGSMLLYHVRPSPDSANPQSLLLAPPQVYCRNYGLARAPISIPAHPLAALRPYFAIASNSTSALLADSSRQVLLASWQAASSQLWIAPRLPSQRQSLALAF